MKRSYIKRQPNKKRKPQSQADKLWAQLILSREPFCKLCGKPAQQIHHFFPKGQYANLRYVLTNGIPLCMGCHFRLHHADPTLTAKIIDKCGTLWYQRLKEKSQQEFISGNTVKYYKEVIHNLTKG